LFCFDLFGPKQKQRRKKPKNDDETWTAFDGTVLTWFDRGPAFSRTEKNKIISYISFKFQVGKMVQRKFLK
jgi:hypothetical protein